MEQELNRRDFLKTATLAGLGFWVAGRSARAQGAPTSPNEKLDIGMIGCGGRAEGNLEGVASENIVALCDVDEARAANTFNRYPKAARYHDFRRMLEEQKNLDAVVISTPDHVHAVAAVMAMKLGKHVYCEKPLTRTVYEARVVRETARQTRVATQMGNQGHANSGARRAVEVIQAGAIGPVREVHAWTDRPIWPQGLDRPKETPSVPTSLDWYLWLGPAPDRPYHPAYHPFAWRGWWDFGCGALGDMGCHVMDMAFWALKLEYPTSVVAEVSSRHPECAPEWSIVTYQFPARGELPPVKFVWYDGKKKPPAELAHGQPLADNGSLLVGDKGVMLCNDAYGASFKLLPEKDFEGYQGPPETIPRSPGHHAEWIQACKGGPPAMSNFEYAALLTEVVVLGNVAIRAGRKIRWDGAKMRVTSPRSANAYIREEPRPGWSLS